MRFAFRGIAVLALSLLHFVLVRRFPQLGNSGSIEGVVKDPSGAAVVNATVEIKDPVSGYLTNHKHKYRRRVPIHQCAV